MQIRLKTFLVLITLLSVLFAVIFADNKFVLTVAMSVIVANVLGAVAALVLTHVFKMPTDGSYWREGRDDNEGKADQDAISDR